MQHGPGGQTSISNSQIISNPNLESKSICTKNKKVSFILVQHIHTLLIIKILLNIIVNFCQIFENVYFTINYLFMNYSIVSIICLLFYEQSGL